MLIAADGTPNLSAPIRSHALRRGRISGDNAARQSDIRILMDQFATRCMRFERGSPCGSKTAVG